MSILWFGVANLSLLFGLTQRFKLRFIFTLTLKKFSVVALLLCSCFELFPALEVRSYDGAILGRFLKLRAP